MQLHQPADAAVGCGQAELAFGFQMNLLAGWRAEGGHCLQTFAEGRGEGLGIYFTFTIAAGTVGFHLLTSSSEKRLTWQGENGRNGNQCKTIRTMPKGAEKVIATRGVAFGAEEKIMGQRLERLFVESAMKRIKKGKFPR